MTVMTKMTKMRGHQTRSASGWHIYFCSSVHAIAFYQATMLSGLELQMNKFFAVNFTSYIEQIHSFLVTNVKFQDIRVGMEGIELCCCYLVFV